MMLGRTLVSGPLRRAAMIGAACTCLVGCATYATAPLADRPALREDIAGLDVDASNMPLPELREHAFDPFRPLDMDEVAMIAVVNNPDLRAARDQMGVAR